MASAALQGVKEAVSAVINPQKSMVSPYERLLHDARRNRLAYDKEYWLNVAFYVGEQYVRWNPDIGMLQRMPRASNAKLSPRPVSNKIMHFVQTEHADVLQQRPTVDVLPASEDPNDISNANVALAYLKWLAEPLQCDFDGVLAEAALHALAGTEAYIKWTWDSSLRDGKGRGVIEACHTLDVYPDPYAKRFKDCRYVIHSMFMDTEQVFDKWGVQVSAEQVERQDPVKLALAREMGMTPILQGVYVHELWMKPCRRHPNGVYTVWTGHTMLQTPIDFPYAHGRLPFTQIGSIGRPGNLHYTSAVTFLRSPQMELNKIHSQMIQVRESFANPKWFIPSELEMERYPDDSPNQILVGNTQNGTLKPELIQPTNLAGNDDGAWVVNEMADIVGVHDVSNGQVPGRVESGQAISMLQDSDDSRLAEMTRTIEVAITEGYYQQLLLAQQYHDEEQMIQAYSMEGIAEVHKFMGTNISDGMRIQVTMNSGLSNNRAARLQQLMTLWQNQIIRDPELMAELLEMPVSSVSPSNAFDIRLARNENYTMEAGAPVTPNSWDNHDIHRREHNNFRKTTEYMNLSPQVKAMFEYHVNMHDQLQITSLGQQLQIQQQAAEVASGAGFQQGAAMAQAQQQGGAPVQPGANPVGRPSQAHQGGPATGAAGGTNQSSFNAHGSPQAPPTVPNAMGAHTPVNVDDVRNSAQGAASYVNRYASELSRG